MIPTWLLIASAICSAEPAVPADGPGAGLAGAPAGAPTPPEEIRPADPEAPASMGSEPPRGEDGGIPGLPPGQPPPADQVDDVAWRIGKGLRCPVCQGLSVADSTSEAAVIMQRRIRELVAQGYAQQEIEDYFTNSYGTWILLDPPGQERMVWLGPGLALAVALVIAVAASRSRGAAPPPAPVAGTPTNDYQARLLAEVDDEP